jgi:hypothetical protein
MASLNAISSILEPYRCDFLTAGLTIPSGMGLLDYPDLATRKGNFMKLIFALLMISFTTQSFGKMVLTKEIKRGPITKDACGNFDDGVKALQRLQDTTTFDNDGQIAFYNFTNRAMAALYREKMIHEKHKGRREYYRGQYELACRNSG